jgi:hypothetical protein
LCLLALLWLTAGIASHCAPAKVVSATLSFVAFPHHFPFQRTRPSKGKVSHEWRYGSFHAADSQLMVVIVLRVQVGAEVHNREVLPLHDLRGLVGTLWRGRVSAQACKAMAQCCGSECLREAGQEKEQRSRLKIMQPLCLHRSR